MTQSQFRSLAIGDKLYHPILRTPAIVHSVYSRKIDDRFVYFITITDESESFPIREDSAFVAAASTSAISSWDAWKTPDTSMFVTSPFAYLPAGFSNTSHDYLMPDSMM